MAKIAIVYHSGFGHTKVVAVADAAGAATLPGTGVELVPVGDLPAPEKDKPLGGRWGVLNAADAIVFGTPTYMGSPSAAFKKFMEDSSGIWYVQGWKDKLAGGFTNAGGLSGDKLNSIVDLVVFAGQHSMVWVSQGVMPSTVTGQPGELNRMGSWLGAMAQSDNAAPDVSPPQSDRVTAELYGRRVAEAAARWARPR